MFPRLNPTCVFEKLVNSIGMPTLSKKPTASLLFVAFGVLTSYGPITISASTTPMPNPTPTGRDHAVNTGQGVSKARLVETLLRAEESEEVKAAREDFARAEARLAESIKNASLKNDPELSQWWEAREKEFTQSRSRADFWTPIPSLQREFYERKTLSQSHRTEGLSVQVRWTEGNIKETQLSSKQEKATETFYFINSGESDLSISQVTASCGCTVPEYSQKSIAPDEVGSVTLEYVAKPPGLGRPVTAQVKFSDGSTANLAWRLLSAHDLVVTPSNIPMVTWGNSDMTPKTIELDLPPGYSLSSPVHPPEVSVEAKMKSETKLEVTLTRVSDQPFWGAIIIRTEPPLDEYKARINVRAVR
jgi:hypothetical protein